MKYKITARRFQIYDKAGMHYIFSDSAKSAYSRDN